MMALEGASFGFQAGGQATDFVLVVMNERGARSMLSGKGKIGGDAAAAVGPRRPGFMKAIDGNSESHSNQLVLDGLARGPTP